MNQKLILLSCFFLLTGIVFGQTQITGLVTSASDGEPMIGVSVVVKGTSVGTVTDLEGEYALSVPESAEILVFSFVGMRTAEIPIDGKGTIDVSLQVDALGLDEVVVVGYGTQRKSDLTGAIVTIGDEDFEAQPVNRIDQILQGRTAGVNVTNSSGAPGGELSMRIRGANSINGNNNPLIVVDGFVGGDFRNVNPADIESIQVLKDASSTAIYGSRGANGVILVTTKGGRIGKPAISVTGRFFTATVLNKYDLMDAATFAQTANERADAVGSARPFTDTEIDGFRQNGGTDWQDEIFRRAYGQEYQVDYTGGSEKVGYYVSGNYLDQDGILLNSYYKRMSLRTNVDAKITRWLDSDIKLSFVRRVNNNTDGDGRTDGSIGGALAWSPTVPARDADGVPTVRDPYSSIKSNPIELAENDRIREENTLTTNGGFLFKIIDGLTLNIGYGVIYINRQQKDFNAGRLSNNPDATRGSRETFFLQNTNTLQYDKIFGGIHRLTLTGVVEHQLFQSDEFRSTATNLQFPEYRYNNITLSGGLSSVAEYEKSTIRSFIARANYALMDRYLVTVSVRSDGSSKFREDNTYSTFPSVGLGWRISEEDFLQNAGWLDNLKLRGSWGQTGSQGIDVYGTVTTYYTDDYQAGTSWTNGVLTPGIKIGNPGNPDLKWETTTQFNVGLDLAVLGSRLGLEMDYFQKNTTDLLISEPIPEYAGGGSIFRNLGEVNNTGFEFSLTGRVGSNSNFNWYSTLNATFLQNEVVDLGGREKIFLDGDAGAGMTNLPENVLIPGYGLSNFWGLNYLGTWKSSEAEEAAVYGNVPGDSKFQDLPTVDTDGDGVPDSGDGVIDADDYQIIGSGIPETLLGWNNTFTYRGFSLNIFLQSMLGYDKWHFAYGHSVMPVADARESTHSDILNRWNTGNETDIPHFSETDLVEIQSSRFIEKSGFLRLKNLSLTYNFPQDLMRGVGGSITVGAVNLLTITDYKGVDPEAFTNRGDNEDARGADPGAYPNAKMWTVGLNLVF